MLLYRSVLHRRRYSNNLKQIGLAFHQCQDSKRNLPSTDWPCTIRPYIEQHNYKEGTPIQLYLCPSRSDSNAPQRDYSGGRQPNSALFAERLAAITDGTSNTMLLADRCALADGSFPTVELNPWYNYDPGEEAINDTAAPDGSLTPQGKDMFAANLGFGSRHAGSMTMLMCDGSVRRFPYGLKSLQAIIGRNDGLVIDLPN